MKENLNMDKAFREKLEKFSATPPPHVLDNVMGQMAALKRKKRKAYIGWISAAAVVLIAFIAGWQLNDVSGEFETQLTENIQEKTDVQSKENKSGEAIEINRIIQGQNDAENPTVEVKTLVSKKSDENTTATFVSSELAAKNLDQTITEKRFSFDPLHRRTAVVHSKETDVGLEKSKHRSNPDILHESEMLLLAENAKNFKLQQKDEKGWRVGAHVSPGYSSYEAAHSNSYSELMTNSTSNGNGNVGAGFSVQYKTNKRLRVESGVYYAQSGQKSGNSLQLFARSDHFDLAYAAPESKSMYANTVDLNNGQMAMNSTAGVINFSGTPKGAEVLADLENFNPQVANSLVSTGEFSQVFDFIEIPLYLRYLVLDSKLDIEVLGGVNAGIVVGNNAYIDNSYGVQNIGSTQDISSTNLSGTLGLGFNYGLGKHLSVAMEPRFNYYLNSINKNPEVDFRPYRLGFFTGLYYEF